MGKFMFHRFKPMMLAGLGALAAIAVVSAVVRDLQVASSQREAVRSPSQQTDQQQRHQSADPESDAPRLAAHVHEKAQAVRDDLSLAISPVIERTEELSHNATLAAALGRGDFSLLRKIANEAVAHSGELDAVAFVNLQGKLLAVNTVDSNGVAIPLPNIERLLAADFSNRAVVKDCIHSNSVNAVFEFQRDCEFSKILWNSDGLSIACSAPIHDPASGKKIGIVTSRLRFTRIQQLVNGGETTGLDLFVVGADGKIFDEGHHAGELLSPDRYDEIRELATTMNRSGIECATVAAHGGIACAYPVKGLQSVEGGNICVAGFAAPGLVTSEISASRFQSTVTAISLSLLAIICVVLTVQNRAERSARRALVVARNEADASNRSKTEFLANMSHEIRTPMTAILGYVDLLADHADLLPNAPSREEAVETIRRNARHLLSLINDVLDLSKIEAGQMQIDRQKVRTMDLVQDALRMMDDRARQKGLTLRLLIDGEVPESIHTDPTRLRQILINLLGNAVKFTETGGITLTVRREDPQENKLTFEVADTGIGMTPEQLSRLYQPFMQADMSTTRRYGGTGLGLAITRRCADILGGTIAVRSAPGAGTSFTITVDIGNVTGVQAAQLPGGSRSPSIGSLQIPSAMRQSLSGVRVLLAEDGIDNQRLICFHLARAGAHVEVVDNGAKAVERVQDASRLEQFDIVLMDMQMPIMDGYEAVRVLANSGAHPPIIALTAHAMPGDREKCMSSGCHNYLCKPLDPRALIAAIRLALTPGTAECAGTSRTEPLPRQLPGGSSPRAAAS